MSLSLGTKASTSVIALQHAGNVTLFDVDEMESAMSAAVTGDTIYLNEGTFDGFTITKQVSIIGAGENTIINGSVKVTMSSDSTTLTSRLLDALTIEGFIYNTTVLTGMEIRKCTFQGIYFSANVYDVLIESCYCTGEGTYTSTSAYCFKLSTYVQSMTVQNSKIHTIIGCGATYDAAVFLNCNIYEVLGGDSSGNSYSTSYPAFCGIIMNSIVAGIVYKSSSYYYLSPYATLINVLYGSSYLVTYSQNSNCIQYSSPLTETTLECVLTTTELEDYEYLGNDGTVVGIYGGTTTYSLTPSTPTVESSTISVDTANKKLNVTIKVTTNS